MVTGDDKARTQEERLRLVQLGEEKALGGPHSIFLIWLLRNGARLCKVVCGRKVRDDRHKLKWGKCKLVIRRSFSTLRTVGLWCTLPGEGVRSPSSDGEGQRFTQAHPGGQWPG